jgi:lysozyme
MKTCHDGMILLKHYEGCSLKAYVDPGTGGEPITIGYGCTNPGVLKLGDTCTQDEADRMLVYRLSREFEPGISQLILAATPQQFDAFVSLAFNIGLKNFKSSSVLRKHNMGDTQGAADSFLLWNKAGGNVMKGLQRRRYAERSVYLGGDAPSSIEQAERTYR